jgi:hypothetical protein
LKKHLLPLALAALAILTFQCSSPQSLSNTEKAKLDAPLIRLLTGAQVDNSLVDETIRPDGTREYAVIVRSEHPQDIQVLGVPVSSISGNMIVVHATIEELRKIVSLPTVRSLESGSKKTILRTP